MTITELGELAQDIKDEETEFYITPYVPLYIHPYDTRPIQNFQSKESIELEKLLEGTGITKIEYLEAKLELEEWLLKQRKCEV